MLAIADEATAARLSRPWWAEAGKRRQAHGARPGLRERRSAPEGLISTGTNPTSGDFLRDCCWAILRPFHRQPIGNASAVGDRGVSVFRRPKTLTGGEPGPLRTLAGMTRYFFDVIEDDQVTPDEEGVELPGIEEARREAVQSLSDMAKELAVDLANERRKVVIRVRDESGEVLTGAALFDVKTRPN